MYEVVRELIGGEEIPLFADVRYDIQTVQVPDVQKAVLDALAGEALLERILPGERVAITAGSRQIANIVTILRTVVDAVKGRGAKPYIVAAMGSHGGATDEGQRVVLAGYGITEAAMGCDVVSHMETVNIGKSADGHDVCIDAFAAGCDKIIVVGRVKSHTDFHGPVESGLAKMIAIGLGKQHGAELCHKLGFPAMSHNVVQFAHVALEKLPFAFGVAIVEDAFHHTAQISGVAAERFEADEPALLEQAKALMPCIPFDKIDILIVDEIGKNISGAGMDPNITGRSPRLGIGRPYAQRIVVLDIANASHGAGTGIGNADAITRRAYQKYDFDVTYANGITSNDPESIRIPAVMPSDKTAIQFALNTLMGADRNHVRIVWIRNTGDLSHIRISEGLVAEARMHARLTLEGQARAVQFDENGNLPYLDPEPDTHG